MTAYIFSQEKNKFYDEVVSFLSSQGIECVTSTANADFTVVLGGDGSVLGAGRQGVPNPIVVINTGHLGFLTSSGKENYQDTLKHFLEGNYTLTKRRTLRVQMVCPISIERYNAVNEVVITKNQLSKLIQLKVYIMERDDPTYKELVSEYRADGLIVATPTGSTAYNLSAGGPIIHPSCESFVITPICSHGLTQRPLVLPGNMKVRIESMDSSLYMSVDGQDGCPMWGNVDVWYNSHCIETVNPHEDSYFQILRQKLGWGVRPV
jgi:Predicted sugar kinase